MQGINGAVLLPGLLTTVAAQARIVRGMFPILGHPGGMLRATL